MFAAEVLFFYLSGPLIRRVGVRGVIALAQLAYLTRFVYYSVGALGVRVCSACCRTSKHGSFSVGTVGFRLYIW